MLEDYLNDSADTRNLANTAEPLEPSSAFFDGGCPKMSSPQATDASASIVDRLDLAVTLNLKIATGRPARSAISIGTHALAEVRPCIGFFLFPFPMVMVVTNRKFPLRVLRSGDTFDKTRLRLIQEGRLGKSIKAMKVGRTDPESRIRADYFLWSAPAGRLLAPRKL